MPTLYDFQSPPTRTFIADITHCQLYDPEFRGIASQIRRRRTWTLRAASIEDAEHLARYHFFMSEIHSVREASHKQ